MRMHEEVSDALASGRPVVALESTIISHGLPRPRNLEVAREIEAAVRSAGAVPATIALVSGEVRIGLDDAALEAIAGGEDVVKCGVRDLAPAAARGAHGATTVAATSVLAVARRDRRVRHGRARRRAPRGARDAGTSRRTSARSRARRSRSSARA